MSANRPILKVLANGWHVPCPEEAVYQGLPFLKDYRLNDFPGKAKGAFDEEAEYFDWLADYLYTCAIDLTAQQEKIKSCFSENSTGACSCLGGIAGAYENVHAVKPAYHFPKNFETQLDIKRVRGRHGDMPYQNYRQWLSGTDEPLLSETGFILEDYGYCLLLQREKRQFRACWPDFVKLQPHHWMFGLAAPLLEPADAAWRVHLACILKTISRKSRRIEAIQYFYGEYGDALHA